MKNVLGRTKDLFYRGCIILTNRRDKLMQDVRGMGTIEVVLIVAILVALALLFKTFITKYANNVFSNIEQKTDAAFQDW